MSRQPERAPQGPRWVYAFVRALRGHERWFGAWRDGADSRRLAPQKRALRYELTRPHGTRGSTLDQLSAPRRRCHLARVGEAPGLGLLTGGSPPSHPAPPSPAAPVPPSRRPRLRGPHPALLPRRGPTRRRTGAEGMSRRTAHEDDAGGAPDLLNQP